MTHDKKGETSLFITLCFFLALRLNQLNGWKKVNKILPDSRSDTDLANTEVMKF